MLNLRKIRDGLGISRRALSEASGVSLEAIALIENGTTYDPKVFTVQRLADSLGVKFHDIYDPAYVRARYDSLRKDNGDAE